MHTEILFIHILHFPINSLRYFFVAYPPTQPAIKLLITIDLTNVVLLLQAMQMRGVDRHLLALKLLAQEGGVELPALYTDPGYGRSTNFRVSTSQVATKCEGFMCYGPAVPDGYGCCYNPRDGDITFGISAFRNCPETSASKFYAELERSLTEMQGLVSKAPPTQSKL